jgi:hypothetical protein
MNRIERVASILYNLSETIVSYQMDSFGSLNQPETK